MKKKVLSVLLITLVLMTTMFSLTVFADGVLENIKPTPPSEGKLIDDGNKIIGAVQTIGVIIAVIMLIILGIRYTTATVGEKAEIKSQLLPYVIGVIFIFGAVGVLQIIRSFDLFGV